MALYKLRVLENISIGALHLAVGTVHYLNHRNNALAIFENIYLKDALEQKFDLSLTADMLPIIRQHIFIEPVGETNLQLLQYELKLVLQQKLKAVKAGNFELTAELRDYEKNVQQLIESLVQKERNVNY